MRKLNIPTKMLEIVQKHLVLRSVTDKAELNEASPTFLSVKIRELTENTLKFY